MLTVTDMWMTFGRHYLDALDHTPVSNNTRDYSWNSGDYARQKRAEDLAARQLKGRMIS